MKNLGIIGISPGNGHPFSFSAIINGYDPIHFKESGWPQIYSYLSRRDLSEFGFPNVRVTHAWTPDPVITEKLCKSCRIPHQAECVEEMFDYVDAVLIARDDPESHYSLAMPFLKRDIPVFIDKPLTLSPVELEEFTSYLLSGKLMSCSGMRYARELDEIRSEWESFGKVKLIRGTILNSWEMYGIHMLEAILSLPLPDPEIIQTFGRTHDGVSILCEDTVIQVDALGPVSPIFKLEVYGERRHFSTDITDNFTMFRRMIWHFIQSLETGRPAIPAESTLRILKTLHAGRKSAEKGERMVIRI